MHTTHAHDGTHSQIHNLSPSCWLHLCPCQCVFWLVASACSPGDEAVLNRWLAALHSLGNSDIASLLYPIERQEERQCKGMHAYKHTLTRSWNTHRNTHSSVMSGLFLPGDLCMYQREKLRTRRISQNAYPFLNLIICIIHLYTMTHKPARQSSGCASSCIFPDCFNHHKTTNN